MRKKILALATALLQIVLSLGLAPAAQAASSPSSYYFGTDHTIRLADSPLVLEESLVIGPSSTVTVEAGVEIFVTHRKPAFTVDGELIFAGTKEQPVRVHNASILFEKQAEFEARSRVEARYLFANNLLGIFESLIQGISLDIRDSSFAGRKDARSPKLKAKTPNSAWLTFVRELTFERNSFEMVPSFYIESFIDEPELTIRDNLFVGNSSTAESVFLPESANNIDGHWLKVRSIDNFTGNTFLNPDGPVLKKVSYPGPIVTPKDLDASGNFWAIESGLDPDDFTDSDSFGVPVKISSSLAVPSAQAPSLEVHQANLSAEYEAFQKTLSPFSGSTTTLTATHKTQIKEAVQRHDTSQKFICTGIRYFSQPMSVNIMVLKRAKAACEYAKSLDPHLSTWYQNKPTRAASYAGKVLLTVKFLDFGEVTDSEPVRDPVPAERETAWFGSANAFVEPMNGIPFRSLYENQCMDASSSWGRAFLEIFGFLQGVYCSGDDPDSHYTVHVTLPGNFRPTEWRVVFDVFVPRYEGSGWAGTGHAMLPSSDMRYYSASSLVQRIYTEWSDEIPADGSYHATIIRSWTPFDTYIAVDNMRVEFKGLDY